MLTESKNTTQSYYYLVVSQTNSAVGIWNIYKFDMTKDGAISTTNWSDFPGLGISSDKIVLSGTVFFLGQCLSVPKITRDK